MNGLLKSAFPFSFSVMLFNFPQTHILLWRHLANRHWRAHLPLTLEGGLRAESSLSEVEGQDH